MMIEEESVSDDSGNVTVITSVADDVFLPVTMILKGSEGRLSLTITYDGQSVKMKPEKLDSGAVLTIPDRGGEIYFDFHKPEDAAGEEQYQIFWMENRWEIKTVPIILWRT